MERLIEGYRRFRATQWPERRASFEALAQHGQSPRAMVIACFLGPWMRIAEPAKQKALACTLADRQTVCEREAVKLSLENLLTFPWIAERVNAARVRLHGAIFDIRTGVLSVLQGDGSFAPV